jgi:hypothetical protein
MLYDHSNARSMPLTEAEPCDTVDAAVLDDLVEIKKLLRTLEPSGVSLVCVHCGDRDEPVVALVTLLTEPPELMLLCGSCCRELYDLAIGEVS